MRVSQPSNERELKNTSYELFILLISCLALLNFVILILPGVNTVLKEVIIIVSVFLTLIFFGDFLYRLFSAKSKSYYFLKDWGWADLLACVPFQQFQIFRVFRIVKVVRLMHRFGLRNMLYEVRNKRGASSLAVTIFLVILVLEFAGTSIAFVEAANPGANIKTGSDAVWWGFVTITTVGYGDHHPVTNAGRIVGMVVMMVGVGLFGVLTGFLANAFLTPSQGDGSMDLTLTHPVSQIAEFRRLLTEQDKANQELRTRLGEIEKLLENDSASDK